jgi:uncharacterized protein (TIGR02145 family)
MKKFLLCGYVFFISITSYAQNAEAIYKKIVNSTVTIETEDALGSGFFVAPNIIATNYHVIKGSVDAYCLTNNSSTIYKIEGYIAVDKSNDLVLLKVHNLNRPSLIFANASVKPGQNIYVIGSPKGLPATISNGIISGLRKFNSNDLIQITAPISPGSSGGPVMDIQGQLIGVSVSQLSEGQNLNFAIPSKYLKELIAKSSTTKDLSLLLGEDFVPSVTIGGKKWMSTNLNVDRFQNGDPIQEAKTEEEWKQAAQEGKPAWCFYENNPNNGAKYGKLYNWYAVVDPRDLAPRGWHIPTQLEWVTFIHDISGDTNNAGNAIKSLKGWEEGNGTNSTGFTAFPSGARWVGNKFNNLGTSAFWWTGEEVDKDLGLFLLLTMDSNKIYGRYGDKRWGLSVRCVKN